MTPTTPSATRRALVAVVVLLAAVLTGCTAASTPPDAPAARTLVLYDTTGPYGKLGELYGTQLANLASHFGSWRAHPVTEYQAGEAADYSAIVYVGSTYDEPLPAAFLDDVAAAVRPVLWLNDNIWQLGARHHDLAARLGFSATTFDPQPVTQVRYQGTLLTRDVANAQALRIAITDPGRAQAVGEALHADGTAGPWAVRSGSLTYVGELPLAYISPDDRYLALTDLLFDVLAPGTPERHRALVRIEDVGPQSDPAQLRAIADYLAGRGVPFSVAVFVAYDDPTGRANGGTPVHRTLAQTPDVVSALTYMRAKGSELIMHGYTHGYAGAPNPYGVSGEDFEYFRAHVDASDAVVLDGPVPEDSPTWAADRLAAARAGWQAAGLPQPTIFEFPHYAASAVDYRAVAADPTITARYERALYFGGVLSSGPVDASRSVGQFFPYPVRDVYGTPVIPENLGNVEAQRYNQHEARLPAQILASARRALVVRDGTASFFYHPFLGLTHLPELVEGIQAMGYTFVPASTMITEGP